MTIYIVLAGAGFSAENLDKEGKEILDYQSCKNKDLFKGYTYNELVNHDMYFKDYEIFHEFMVEHTEKLTTAVLHKGYNDLFDKIKDSKHFVITTNVDNKFREIGFENDNIFEVHGNLKFKQCGCGITTNETENIKENGFCGGCNTYSRPNVWLFDDPFYNKRLWHKESKRFNNFIREILRHIRLNKTEKICILETGCGLLVPTLKNLAKELFSKFHDYNVEWHIFNLNEFEIENISSKNKKLLNKKIFLHKLKSSCIKEILDLM